MSKGGQMINKAWKCTVVCPRIELATYLVAGQTSYPLHYFRVAYNATASQEFNLALTPNLGILRRLELD